MTELKVEVDPADVGFDAQRLERIDSHFRRYVDDGRLPGWLVLVARRGQIAHLSTYGQRDKEAGAAVDLNTLWRIYSMTKPITSVAAMMLYEEGAFELKDPISKWLPAFADTKVYRSGSAVNPLLDPQVEPIRVWHLLTHTSGITYGFLHAHPVDAMYRAAGFEFGSPPGADLAAVCDTIASLPLVFQPGTEWNYGASTDVLGRLVEVISGQPLDVFFEERIFRPLGMSDTGFYTEHLDRLAALYFPSPETGQATRYPDVGETPDKKPVFLSGGGGLISSAADYHRFNLMLLQGGELEGVRLLGSRTVQYMTKNHLPGGTDLEQVGRRLFAETAFAGVGFGLGFSVQVNDADYKVLSSVGEYAWGGAASTAFWIDPAEEISVLFLTQLLPSSTHPIRPQLKQLVYQALVD